MPVNQGRIVFVPVPSSDSMPGIDEPIVGTWAPPPVEARRVDVDFERTAVLFTSDGRALVRKAGF